MIANFHKASGITLTLQQIPFPVYDSKSQTALAAGNGPDILQVNSVTMGAFILKNYLQSLDSHLASSTALKRAQFYPGLWKHGTYAGKQWGLPIDTGTRALFYNKRLLSAAKVAPPTNHAEFAAAALKLTDPKSGVYGYNYMGGNNWVWLYEALGMLTIQDQAAIVTPDLKQCLFDRSPTVDALKLLVQLQQAGAAPKGAITDSTDQRAALFAAGRAAMTFFGFWIIPVLAQLKMPPSAYGIVNLRGRTGKIGSSTGGWVLTMPSAGGNKDAAWKFFEFVFQPANLVGLTSIMPATLAANAMVLKDPIYAQFKEVLAVNSQHPIPLSPFLPQQSQIILDASQNALIGRLSVEDAAKQATDQINTTLSSLSSL
jgi:ABC-type glycerol-3-phosphate transport system substrate-binding protein